MKDEKDIRLIILRGLDSMGHSTEQKEANKFLSEIKTYHGKEDLGTIWEALQELNELKLIKETRKFKRLDEDMDTHQQPPKDWKSPQRFIKQVGDAPKISRLFLTCTIKGKQFLIEWEQLKRVTWMTKYDIPIKIIFVFLGALITLAITYVTTRPWW